MHGAANPISSAGSEFAGSEWIGTLELVDQAADDLRLAEERIQQLEDCYEQAVRYTTEQIDAARARVQAADRRAQDAEHRERDAEDRARASREWLVRVQESLVHLPLQAESLRGRLIG